MQSTRNVISRGTRLWRGVTGIWMGLILIGSFIPAGGGGPNWAGWHVVGYAILSALLARWLAAWPAGLLAWGYGAVVEAVQWVLPTRNAEVGDLVANAAGVAVGLIATWAWPRLRRRYISSRTTS
ncbi:MAG: VanZ family protein [Candidatus Omnitrophota bacterium]|nr:VanZ family protein [Candidatus Omnitrophota bacterium]